ncbi:uncharacterized protein LOC129593898 isoform X2 [Paramacrobiotus metropolitanus]|uniref:uncharacterized protein LOC129593898 isoform X2 n=1 Tax=Paramacrobiotus metropolitanus TaxID=2943436 RepID=UPI002445FDDD|nr:uncharacterized protein LOC129593898 isoform X2 [Paramacrobiotus metropolitanus]
MANRILSFVAALGEVCSRDNIIPDYDLLKVEGPCHDPVFIIRAVAGKYQADGRGSKKQTAKQEAAKKILLEMGELSLEDLKIMESKAGFESAKVIGNVVDGCSRSNPGAIPIKDKERNRNTYTPIPVTNQINPLGDLIEISLIMGWPHPKVVDEQKTGPAHDPRFTVSCYFAKFKTFATSKSKKEAKRLAALEMHENMRYQPEIMYKYSLRTGRPLDPSSVWNTNSLELMGSEPYASGIDFCYSGVPKILEIAGAQSIDMLKNIGSVDEIANPEIFLRSIIKECHFEMQFESLMEDLSSHNIDSDGEISPEITARMLKLPLYRQSGVPQKHSEDDYDSGGENETVKKNVGTKLRDNYTAYCILKLPIKNPIRLLGCGSTPKDARYSAARKALQYVRVMALKDPV